MRPEALIFDCDGVLVDSEAIFLDEERRFLAELGLTYDAETYQRRFMGLNNVDWISALTVDYEGVGLGVFPPDFLERKRARTWPRIQSELEALPGALNLIEAFSGKVATASSSDSNRLAFKLKKTGLAGSLTPHIYSAEQVENGKPAPDLFLYAAAHLGVPAARCAVVEDSEHGIRAAIAANMRAIGFIGGGHANPALGERLVASGAHHIVESHQDLATLVGVSF